MAAEVAEAEAEAAVEAAAEAEAEAAAEAAAEAEAEAEAAAEAGAEAETAAEPLEVEAIPVSAQPVWLQSINLLSGWQPSRLLPRALAPSAPFTPLSAVSTPIGAATTQAAARPAAAAAGLRKDWTELEDEEILRRHTQHTPRDTRPSPSSSRSPSPTP